MSVHNQQARAEWQERVYDTWIRTACAASAANVPPSTLRPHTTSAAPTAPRLPWDGHHLHLGAEPELLLISRTPTATQLRNFQTGPADFRLHLNTRILVLIFRFGDLPWAMEPWALWQHPVDESKHLLPGGLNDPVPFRVRLLRPDQGVIAERLVTWPAGFAGTVRIAIRSALTMGCHPEYAYSELVRLLRECPTPDGMVASTANALAEYADEFSYTEST